MHQTIVAFSFLSERATTLSVTYGPIKLPVRVIDNKSSIRDVNRCETNAFCQNETLNLCSGGGFFC